MGKSKFATAVLSIVPGMGHLYLGYQERGLQFLLAFFIVWLVGDLIRLPMVFLLLAAIWFYSIFDAIQCISNGVETDAGRRPPWAWLLEKQRLVGFGLIALGGLIMIQRAVVPALMVYLDYHIIRMIGTAVLALIFIAGGIRLVAGKPLDAPKADGNRAGKKVPEGDEE